MQINLLYFDGSPSWQVALKSLKAALDAKQVNAEIRLAQVETDEDAARLKFLGSPSFCVNGVDWWPEQRARYNLNCRVYATPQGLQERQRLKCCVSKCANCAHKILGSG